MREIRRFLCVFTALLFLFSTGTEADGHPAPIRCAPIGQPVIALTFDDGPHPVYTPMILDLLAKYGIRATFFVIGENAEKYPELLAREKEEGHEIGNHTFSHKIGNRNSPSDLLPEIRRTSDLIGKITGDETRLFRPPGGVVSGDICKIAGDIGYETILWSIDTEDWKRPGKDRIVSEITENVKNGSIILCHDFVVNSQTPAALEKVIPLLLDRGYEFVTVSELLERSLLQTDQ